MAVLARFLRPHQIGYRPYAGQGGDGAAYGPAEAVWVRFERKSGVIRTADGRTKVARGRVFWPATPEPVEESIVTYRGREYEVAQIDELVNIDGSTHHYEVVVS